MTSLGTCVSKSQNRLRRLWRSKDRHPIVLSISRTKREWGAVFSVLFAFD
jgi:hypothetical protein